MKCGITYTQFFHMTLAGINATFEAYSDMIKDENDKMVQSAWLIGMYVCHSIASTMGKNHKYPESPLVDRIQTLNEDMTEEEKLRATQELFTQLEVMKNNFERNKANMGEATS